MYDDPQSFCLDDGTPLIADMASHSAQTVVMNPKKKSKLPIVFVALLGLLVVGITGAWFLIQRNYGDSQRHVANVISTPGRVQAANNNVTATSNSSIVPADAPQVTVENSAAIATKDIGSLRVVLKSFSPLKLDNGQAGVRVVFEFTNLEKEKPIVVAMNANACGWNCLTIGDHLRSTLVDENGGTWLVSNPDVAGMSIVGVGTQHANGPLYNPAEIAIALAKRDEVKSDVLQEGGSEFHLVFGSTTEMEAGHSQAVTVNFAQDQPGSGPPPKVFQLASEIVVGVVNAGSKTAFSMHNLTFDRVRLAN